LDPRNLGRLALPHLDALYRTARRLAARPADAADLVQQTYLEASRSFGSLRDETRCRAWLFRILHHVWYHQRARSRSDLEALRGPGMEPTGDLEREIADGGYSDEVDQALRAIPEEFRVALLLVAVEELSYEGAAEVMGCPIGTVRSRVARGRALLAAALRGTAAAQRSGKRGA
jgi:RNA polymerase sigma-70 factor (ECF subfamily)